MLTISKRPQWQVTSFVVPQTAAEGLTLEEGRQINKSLSALSNVVQALTSAPSDTLIAKCLTSRLHITQHPLRSHRKCIKHGVCRRSKARVEHGVEHENNRLMWRLQLAARPRMCRSGTPNSPGNSGTPGYRRCRSGCRSQTARHLLMLAEQWRPCRH